MLPWDRIKGRSIVQKRASNIQVEHYIMMWNKSRFKGASFVFASKLIHMATETDQVKF